MTQSFEQWMDEIEAFSTRRERAMDDLGSNYEKWLWAAWSGGMDCENPGTSTWEAPAFQDGE